MPGSAARFLMDIGFSLLVVIALHFFGMSVTTAWLTFLALFLFAALAEIGFALDSINDKLDAISKRDPVA